MGSEDPFSSNNGIWFYETLGKIGLGSPSMQTMQEWDFALTAVILAVPAYRPLVSIMEKLCEDNGWHIDDLHFTMSEPYQNQVFGWSLGTGWIAARECTREAFVEICDFAPGEFYHIHIEPVTP